MLLGEHNMRTHLKYYLTNYYTTTNAQHNYLFTVIGLNARERMHGSENQGCSVRFNKRTVHTPSFDPAFMLSHSNPFIIVTYPSAYLFFLCSTNFFLKQEVHL